MKNEEIYNKHLLEQALLANDRINVLKKLIQSQKININLPLDDGVTALMHVTLKNDLHSVRLLVEAGANLNAIDDFGKSALWFAARWGFREIFDFLKPLTDKELHQDAQEILHKGLIYCSRLNNHAVENFVTAAMNGDRDTILSYIQNGIDVNSQDSEDVRAIEVAAYYGQTEIIKILIDHGADVNSLSNELLETPLISAVKGLQRNLFINVYDSILLESYIEILNLLIEAGVDIDWKSQLNSTALVESIRSKNLKVVKLLVNSGADINTKDFNGDSPLSIALDLDIPEISQFLINIGSKEKGDHGLG